MSLSKPAYAWKFYLHLLNTVPIPTKTVTAMVLGYCGNVITQKVFEKQPKMDQLRAIRILGYYLILMPVAHYWYKFLDRLFAKKNKDKVETPTGNVVKKPLIDSTVLKKLALDELLFDPFCIVLFFSIVGLLERKSLSQIREKIGKEYWITQKMSWRVWPAVQLLNFAFVPGHLRILFINLVSFFWSIFLQLRAGNN